MKKNKLNIPYTSERNFGCRLMEFSYKGLKTIYIENEIIRIGIFVDRGTDIFEFLYKPKDVDFMWKYFRGVKEMNFIPGSSLSEGSILDFYHGGWQELFPNAGDAGYYKGAFIPYHGELYSLSWGYDILKDEPEEIIIKFHVNTYRTYYQVEKTIKIKSNIPAIYIKENIRNMTREKQHFVWGHHPAFGPPFLSSDCIIDLPTCEIINDEIDLSPGTSRLAIGNKSKWPITKGRNGESIDLRKIPSVDINSYDRSYIYGFKRGWYGLTNKNLGVGFGLKWDEKIFKYLWFWQVYGGATGYPFYSSTYNIAIEPVSSYPPGIENAIKNNTSIELEPYGEINTGLVAVAYESKNGIKGINNNGDVCIR